MGIAAKILNRINVFVTVYDNGGGYGITLWRCRLSRSGMDVCEMALSDDAAKLKRTPALLLTGGYGVITKNVADAGDAVQRITSDREKFLWTFTEGGETVSFVRRGQYSDAVKSLESVGAGVVGVQCYDAKAVTAATAAGESAKAYFKKDVTLRNILRIDDSGSTLARMAFHKIKMPVLGVILMLLVANALLSPSIGRKAAVQRREIAAMEQTLGRQSESTRNRERTIAEHSGKFPYRYALACDRIAAAVPAGIILTQLALQPLRKALEPGRKPQIAEKSVVIRGEAGVPEDVSAFLSALESTGLFAGINLTSIEKEKESGKTVFRIDISL